MAQAWVTRRQAAFLAKVTEDVIKQWRYRGWIDSEGKRRHLTVDNGRYLHSDVMEAERDTRQKVQRSHRRRAPASLHVERDTRRSPYSSRSAA